VRQLAAFEKSRAQLEAKGCALLAASVDTEELARKAAQAAGLTFPVAFGLTRTDADAIGAWWGKHPPDGEHLQPAEFLLGRGSTVLGSMYASGPVGRMGADEVIRSITSRERARIQREQASGQQRQ
jgi:peroxiredoxin